jgi:dihydroorotate dehydrogenase electron transfer subunit
MEHIDDIEGEILRNEPVVPGYFRASIRLSRPMAQVRPGQFVMLRVPTTEVFLRRPFSIYNYRRGVLSILYKVVGKGTSVLSEARAKEKVMVLGPLGNGFTVLPGHYPVLVGGGIGIAGIYLLWFRLKGRKTLFWGCTSDAEVGLLDTIIPCEPHVSTMDGSFGCKGNVVDLLGQHIPRLKKPVQVFACGPEAMFLSLRDVLRNEHIPCQVLVEERMACGLGICFGCTKKTLDETEPYKRVCKEGPVFDLWQISL